MDLIVAFVFLVLFSVFDALADANIFNDFRGANDYKKKWHIWQGARQLLFISFAGVYLMSWKFVFLGMAIFWILHDGILNKVGLNKPFFFVGTTARIDIMMRRVASWMSMDILIFSMILKLIALIGFGIFFFI